MEEKRLTEIVARGRTSSNGNEISGPSSVSILTKNLKRVEAAPTLDWAGRSL